MTKVAYEWTNDQSRLLMDSLNTKLPTGGQTTKVTYGWIDDQSRL